jgi:Ni/Fe-hydrogenase 1 B-type cytochrome subunit
METIHRRGNEINKVNQVNDPSISPQESEATNLLSRAELPSTSRGTELRQTLYVWDLPVRITHWLNVLCIVVLSVTGYYIANPFIMTQGDATSQYLMGTVRFIHYVTAFVFTMSVLFRVYWAFAGNTYARWSQFLPASRQRLRDLGRMIRYYTFLRREPPAEIGHNPLAGVTYVGLYILFGLQIVTGFALYSLPYHDGWLKAGFGWIVVLVGTQTLRLVHTIIMFLIIAFTIHHVYSAVLIDLEERSGLVSSIVTGRKSLTAQHIAEAQEQPKKKAEH